MLHKMLQVVKDGQPVKMSKRSGTYVTLSDLVNWVGKDAARLFMVNRRADAEFVFDVDLALSQSDENPVYYLRTHMQESALSLHRRRKKAYRFLPLKKWPLKTCLL